MNTFYIAGHGETENSKASRLSGWIDAPLTPDSVTFTQEVVEKLTGVPIDAIYSSDLGRAFITAYIVARGLNYTEEIKRLAGLREVNYGIVANMRSGSAYALYPRLVSDIHFAPPMGESLAQMQDRVFRTVGELNGRHTDEMIALVGHSGTIAALHAGYLGENLGAHSIRTEYPHGYVGRFTFSDGVVTSFEEWRG